MIDLTKILKSLGDKPFHGETKDGEEPKVMNLRDLLIQALIAIPAGAPISPDEKYIKGKLAIAVHDNDRLAFSQKEVTIIKTAVAGAFTSNVLIARVWDVLDTAKPDIKSVETLAEDKT